MRESWGTADGGIVVRADYEPRNGLSFISVPIDAYEDSELPSTFRVRFDHWGSFANETWCCEVIECREYPTGPNQPRRLEVFVRLTSRTRTQEVQVSEREA